jgi:hypothetical protein
MKAKRMDELGEKTYAVVFVKGDEVDPIAPRRGQISIPDKGDRSQKN